MRLRQLATIGLITAFTIGCSSYGPKSLQPGQSEAQVVSTMGQATGRYSLADGGSRLEYARSGETWMVDLDKSGKVVQVAQVLTRENFEQVRSGMNRDDLLRLLGRPSGSSRERGDRVTLSWRYSMADCLWFNVTLTPQDYVMFGAFVADSTCKGNL